MVRAVILLSVFGAIFELVGILIVSDRWGSVLRSLKGLVGRRSRSQIVRPIGIAIESDVAQPIVAGSDAARHEARLRMMEATMEATRADVSAVHQQSQDLASRVDRLEERLPAEIRRRTVAPAWGVLCLVAGLGCFVAANIVGVAG